MRLISWNVNGLNACIKGGLSPLLKEGADIYCMQEVKCTKSTIPEHIHTLKGYSKYWSLAMKPGYSGVGILSRIKPLSVIKGMGIKEYDDEGRLIGLEFDDCILLNVYFPNATRTLSRLDFKLKFNNDFNTFIQRFTKPLIICGDFNVAHTEQDIARPKQNDGNSGFTREERAWFTQFLASGYTDTFRMFTQGNGHYSWWLYMFNARERNIGWRIDYFVVSNALVPKVQSASILKDIRGSDHCPIDLSIDI